MLKRLLWCVFILAVPAWAWSASIAITPVHVHFAPGEKIETITFKNKSNEPVTLQAQIFLWSQKDGQSTYTPTKDLVAAPMIFKLKPNKKQLLRIALRKSTPENSDQQQTYRIFFSQIVPQQVKQKAPEQVNTKLKISLPIFIDINPELEKVQLSTKLVNDQVQLNNAGNVTRLINQIRWMQDDGVTPIGDFQDVFIYLLPGSQYVVPGSHSSKTLQVLTNRQLEVLKLTA